ncbi:MAG: translation elongation factor EF-1 subunit alpha [Candidatus Nanoarchaeia archaeon]|nr:translation elongation factor EF-1 subunit alpha [Candidatus Nanoarchaeia archaeon]
MAKKEHLNLIFMGHVDHGKSTLLGRVFFETGVLTPQQLEKFKKMAEELGKGTWEYAYALDASPEERKRGVTIDLAHKKFETDKYYFTVIDAPGHRDFVKNMITGASQADAAVLVVAASDGVMSQTKEHAYLAKVLGVKQIKVAINKIDVVNYDEKKFNDVKADVTKLLQGIGYDVSKVEFIPTSGLKGDNVAKPSENMTWYKGNTLVKSFDSFEIPQKPSDLPTRVPIQDTFTITGVGTVPVGKVVSGTLKVGDKVVFLPSGAAGEVKTIEMHHEKVDQAFPGDNIGFNVRGIGKTDVKRGDVCGLESNKPTVAKAFKAQIIVMNHPTAITVGYTPVFHAHTTQVSCRFTKLLKKLDPKTGQVAQENPEFLKNGDAAIVEIEPVRPMVIEPKDKIPQLASFAIRDMGQTVAAGVCIEVTQKE